MSEKNIKLENVMPWWNIGFLVQDINKCLQGVHVPEWKYHIDPKEPKQKNRPKQLQIYNLSTDDVENINNTIKRSD